MRSDLNPETQPFPESGQTTSQSPVGADEHCYGVGLMGEDQAQLSDSYVQIRALAARAAKLPEVGQEKASALRKMVLGSSYQPNWEEVAKALFAHMLVHSAV
jgi:hypothetical protein